jgi:hypothetical protein
MTWFMQSKQLIVVAACIGATALAASPTAAQQPDSATINGTIGSPVYGDHTWTLTLQGLSYSYEYFYYSDADWYSITRVYATSFDFEFQGPHAAELNANVSEPFVNGGLQDGPVVELKNYAYWETSLGYVDFAKYWHIEVRPSDYQQGLQFLSWSFDGSHFATGASIYPVLAPFTILNARTSLIDNRNVPGSGYTMGILEGTVSVSSVGFSLPGDYNRDGAVDAADYVAWRKSPSNFGGDPNGYNTWRAHFGRTAGSGATINSAIPEPCGLVLLSSTVLALLRCRKFPRT